MKYSTETIRKYEETAAARVAFWKHEIESGRIPEMRISRGNKKIGNVPNFSTLAVLTCGNCSHCKEYCYAIKDAVRFPANVMESRAINTALLLYAPWSLYEQLENYFSNPRRRNKTFRFNVAGEINRDLFAMITSIAWRHADYTIWMYTKMYHIVNRWIATNEGKCGRGYGKDALPESLSVMFSRWDGMPVDNPYGLPEFAVKLAAGNKDPMNWDSMFKCPGNCQTCLKSGRGCIGKENTYNDEH